MSQIHRICVKCYKGLAVRPSTVYLDVTAPAVNGDRCHFCGAKTRSPRSTTDHPENHVIFDCSSYHKDET